MAFLLLFLLLYRQNVVVVGAGRTSRSARIATSSELLYLLYNMPIECCDEYKLIQLYQKSSVWCFAFSHTSTFELIPAVAMAQPGAVVTVRYTIVCRSTRYMHLSTVYTAHDCIKHWETTLYDNDNEPLNCFVQVISADEFLYSCVKSIVYSV